MGFDAVIGNPPYVRQEGLGDIKSYLQDRFPEVYRGTADLYVYFYARGHDVLRPGGRFGMVTSNKFMRSDYGKPLRDFLVQKNSVSEIVDFGDLPIFPDPTAYPCIFIFEKGGVLENARFTQVKSLDFEELEPVVKEFGVILGREAFAG